MLRGKSLQNFKLAVSEQDGNEIYFVTIKKTSQLGVFDLRAFINLAMLITESEKAKILRQIILDIVIDTINKRTGGGTKYINQRDEDFLISFLRRKITANNLLDALKDCV